MMTPGSASQAEQPEQRVKGGSKLAALKVQKEGETWNLGG